MILCVAPLSKIFQG